MSALLTIMVPTLACRDALYARLEQCLMPQLGTDVELLKLRDDGEQTIGAKRQRLLESASTPYVTFIDDDDLVSPNYCPLIVERLKTGPDVIGFRLLQYDDGDLAAKAIHSVKSGQWYTDVTTGIHYRTPNHLNPVRRELALSVGYDDTRNFGEDCDYSNRLFETYPNMRESFIDQDLYYYLRRSYPHRAHERINPQ